MKILFSTACPHERGAKTNSDYKPLALTTIRKLLKVAATGNTRIVNNVQIRLTQAIPGIRCPVQIDGPVAERCAQLGHYFVCVFMANPRGLGTHARAIYQIIKGDAR